MGRKRKNKVLHPIMKTTHYYIDESGNPEFYGKRNKLLVGQDGFSPILIIGSVLIPNRKGLYRRIEDFKKDLLNNSKLKDVYSLHQPGWFLHAKDDHPAVRDKFFNFLANQKFRGYFIIGRKVLKIFHNRHYKSEKKFYFDLIQTLMRDMFVHSENYKIYLSRRSGNSILAFNEAIKNAIAKYNSKTKKENIEPNFDCTIVPSNITPELSVVDYQLWALQRYIIRNDDKYYKLLLNKYIYIGDPYSLKGSKSGKHYNLKYPFDLSKASKFDI